MDYTASQKNAQFTQVQDVLPHEVHLHHIPLSRPSTRAPVEDHWGTRMPCDAIKQDHCIILAHNNIRTSKSNTNVESQQGFMDWNNPTVKEHMVLPFGLTKALQTFLWLPAAIKEKCFRTLNLISFASRHWTDWWQSEGEHILFTAISLVILFGLEKFNNLSSWAEIILYAIFGHGTRNFLIARQYSLFNLSLIWHVYH